jgi:hypothetical protein
MNASDYTFWSTSTRAGAPGYAERSGQPVCLIGLVVVDAQTGPMYRIRFADGVETDAFADEIAPLRNRRSTPTANS